MTEEILEEIILGYIAKELKDEIQIGRQVKLAKTIIQALRIHGAVDQSEQLICPCCGSDRTYKTDAIHCNRCDVTFLGFVQVGH